MYVLFLWVVYCGVGGVGGWATGLFFPLIQSAVWLQEPAILQMLDIADLHFHMGAIDSMCIFVCQAHVSQLRAGLVSFVVLHGTVRYYGGTKVT